MPVNVYTPADGRVGSAVAAMGDRIVSSAPNSPHGPYTSGYLHTYFMSQCSDWNDQDGDGLYDWNDPDCADPLDDAEWHLEPGDAVVADWNAGIHRIDTATGQRTVLHSGSPLGNPMGVGIAPDGGILVSDQKRDAVFRLDAGRGRVTTVTSKGFLGSPRYLSADPTGDVYVCNQNGLVVQVDLESGGQIALNSSSAIGWCEGVAAGGSGKVVVTDRSGDRLVDVDPATGDTSPLQPGGPFVNPIGIAFEGEDHVVVVDDGIDEIYLVTLSTNTRATLSQGQHLKRPRGVSVEADGRLLVADVDGGLVRIDRDEHPAVNQTVVSAEGDIGTPMGVVVYLPEPRLNLMLTTGFALLAGLRRRRGATAPPRRTAVEGEAGCRTGE
jgi:streptogramin lyase